MTKIWVLEGFISKEIMEKSLNELYEMKANQTDEKLIKACDEAISAYKKRMDKNPDGYWLGYDGKIVYKHFCEEAKGTLRNMKDKKMKWRVVEGELIGETAKYWLNNYKPVKINEGVMKYLWATL